MENRKRTSNEVFTPLEVTLDLLRKSEVDLSDSSKRILEPAAGEGDMIEGIIKYLMEDFGHSFETAQSMIHAVELFEDNCKVIRKRFPLVELWQGDFLEDKSTWKKII